MALVSLQDVRMAYAGDVLLEDVNLQIEEGERVCLLGRNGTGKTTLLKLIHGDFSPDSGSIAYQQNIRIGMLPQEISRDISGKVIGVVSGGFINEQSSAPVSDTEKIWKKQQQIDIALSYIQLDPETEFDTLSAGLKRRVLLGRALVRNPDILLLDEPTNHLDIQAIRWLEDFLSRYGRTLLFVTHDRVFLQKLSTRILELDRGQLSSWDCDYETYLERREEALAAEAQQQARFDKKLAQEEEWIRKGVKARRKRNEGRVRALLKMRELRQARRDQTRTAQMKLQQAERSGDLVVEANDVCFAYNTSPIVRDFSTIIMRGDKVGIIGPNGSGKTTLLQLLLGDIPPDDGKIRLGKKLEMVYYDQMREQLDEEKSVLDNVGEGADMITFNGQKRHLIGYLQDFLFSRERAFSTVKTLSGGERNRLMLAKLFTRPANVLVMDEPTNDLDIETLDLLEELLLEFSGTLLLVSHDRAFLNNVVTSTLVFEGEAEVNEYVGGYDDWLRQRKKIQKEKSQVKKEKPRPQTKQPRRLSYKEQQEIKAQKKELDELPQRIEDLEKEQHELQEAMAVPEFYRQDPAEIAKAKGRLEAIEQELTQVYERWEQLEERFG